MKLAVVILNWNGIHFLKKFLPGVVKHSSIDGVQVVIADNNSKDDSVSWVKSEYSSDEVKVLEFNDNYGFAGGYNKVFEEVEAEYICLLNSDVEVDSNWLPPILSYFEKHPNTAAACSKLRDYNNKEMFEYASACGGYIDKYGYPFCKGRVFEVLEKDEGQYDEITEVLWGAGAALFVKRDLWLELGGLDEHFFAHMEEIDFCWRLNNSGHKLVIIPESIVYHVGGGTLPKNNARKTFLNFRNNLWMLSKNLHGTYKVKTLVIRFCLDMLAAFGFLALRRSKDFGAVIKAWWYYTFKSKHIREYNKKAQMHTKGLPSVGFYNGSIILDYYIRKKKTFSSIINK